MTNREKEWLLFSDIVKDHIREYTVKQYGDAPDDEVEQWTEDQCMDSIKRYVRRFGTNARGELEEWRDMVKIAHFVCMIFMKKGKTLSSPRCQGGSEKALEYVMKIRDGKS